MTTLINEIGISHMEDKALSRNKFERPKNNLKEKKIIVINLKKGVSW